VDASLAVALVSVVAASGTAVAVPYLTFRHSRQLETIRLLATERGKAYVDALAEAHAERWRMQSDAHDRVHGPNPDPRFAPANTQLSDADRAKLGARMAAFADDAVLRTWNDFNGTVARHAIRVQNEGDLIVLRVEAGRTMDALEAAIREQFKRRPSAWARLRR
jgi:hypothetical protein